MTDRTEKTYRQLQDELRERGLPTGGSEADLRQRLADADDQGDDAGTTPTVAPEDAAARENERQAKAAQAAADADAQAARDAGVANAPVRAYDADGNVRPADDRFLEQRAQVDDRQATQVPVAPGSAATMRPVLIERGGETHLYPEAANDLENADEIRARLEAERDAELERAQ